MNTQQYLKKPSSTWGMLPIVLIFTVGILTAGIGGLGIALGFAKVAMLLPLPFALVAIYLTLSRSRLELDTLFFFVLILVMSIPLINRVMQVQLGWMLEAILFLAAPMIIWSARRSKLISPLIWSALALYIAFLILGIISSFFGRSIATAAIYQFGTHLKIIILFAFGFTLAWGKKSEQAYWWFVRWFWLPLIIMVAWQWLHPTSYISVFHLGSRTPHPMSFLPSRALGIFQHSSFLALYSAVFCMSAVFAAIYKRRQSYYIVAILYFVLMIASGQRQEIAALALVLFATYLAIQLRSNFLLHGYLAIILLIVTILAGWYLMNNSLEDEAYRWGFVGNGIISQPRPLFYLSAFSIANDYFPVGSGLGTFAGPGAEKFDLSLHLLYGFGQFKWFYTQNVLSDAALANLIAETGWLGVACFFMALGALAIFAVRGLLREKNQQSKIYWALAFSTLLFGVILIPSSPSFQDPELSLLMTIFIGVAARVSSRSDRSQQTAVRRRF